MTRSAVKLSALPRSVRIVAVLVAVLVAYWLGGRGGPATAPPPASPPTAAASAATVWTCAMHPQIRLSEPGLCPLCGMDLIPVADAAIDDQEWVLEMSPTARRLAEISTAPVERLIVSEDVRMVGKVEYDETRLRTVSARVGGRLDRLFVDSTGVPVQQGEHLVWLYSPELLSAQEELLESLRRVELGDRERSQFLRDSNRRALQSAREKLRLWGLGAAQVREIESRGTAEDHIMITSPVSGIVADKWVKEGDYIETGTRIYTVAELDHVWVKLDAYESDLKWLRYGQEVQLEAEAYPGDPFAGRISFIDPVVDTKTRTVKVRVNVANRDRRLKPGMFIRATVRSTLAEGGRVMDPGLAGKWIGPMHPEIVRDHPGSCPICGMPLVRAEDLGFVSSEESSVQALVVPVSAVLRTGKRAVVYVARPDAAQPTYEGRMVTLGPRAGDRYVVLAGLTEGEQVVVHGNFKIDSALQIQAKPSMMAPPTGSPSTRPSTRPATRPTGSDDAPGGLPPAPLSSSVATALDALYDGYFAIQEALAGDRLAPATNGFGTVRAAASAITGAGLDHGSMVWAEQLARLNAACEAGRRASSLDEARAGFRDLSSAVLAIERTFGHGGDEVHYETFCPMAFDGNGAAWLQRTAVVANPYYGAAMPGCGWVDGRHPGRPVTP